MSAFPNGQILISSALTPTAISTLFQTLTLGILGAGTDYSRVRIEWPTNGQQGFNNGQDVSFLSAVETDDDYNRVRDMRNATNNAVSLQQISTYTRVWSVQWINYGPNSFDAARLIKSALYVDWFHDTLAAANLWLVGDVPATVRAPELFNAQWWERVDLTVKFNEFVTESLITPTIASVEVIASASSTPLIDVTVSAS